MCTNAYVRHTAGRSELDGPVCPEKNDLERCVGLLMASSYIVHEEAAATPGGECVPVDAFTRGTIGRGSPVCVHVKLVGRGVCDRKRLR